MQHLDVSIVRSVKRAKMLELEERLRGFIQANKNATQVVCPFCNYISKNKRGTAKVFNDSFKCFKCGEWRRIR